jgi:hypothetical protein
MADHREWRIKAVNIVMNDDAISVSRLGPALKLLLEDWPTRGPRYLEARSIALAAYADASDKEADEKARLAFIEAAREAGILVD